MPKKTKPKVRPTKKIRVRDLAPRADPKGGIANKQVQVDD